MRLLLQLLAATLLLQVVYASRARESKQLAFISSVSAASIASAAAAAATPADIIDFEDSDDFKVEVQAIAEGIEKLGLIDYIKEATVEEPVEESVEEILLDENPEADTEDDIFGPDVDYIAPSFSSVVDISASEAVDSSVSEAIFFDEL